LSQPTRRARSLRAAWLVVAILAAGIVAALAYNDVSSTVTPDDKVYAERFLRETGHGDLITQTPPTRAGLCYDRSRAIEKILTDLGFKIRHAAVYSTKNTGSWLKSLLTPRTPSHAVSEVKTERGWMVIDSNNRWIGLTRDGKPVDLAELRDGNISQMTWDPRLKEHMSPIFEAPFSYVFGLYSRHGRFYPPYTPFPTPTGARSPTTSPAKRHAVPLTPEMRGRGKTSNGLARIASAGLPIEKAEARTARGKGKG